MKSIAFFLFLGLISVSMAIPSAFLDELFTPSINTANSALVNCSATDTCAGKGDACSGNYPLGGCSRANGTCCAGGLYCVNKTCVTDTYEGLCNTAADCYPGREFACVNKTCQYIMGIGEDCSVDAECYSGNCANGTCQGSAYNQMCNPVNLGRDCDFGLYCGMGMNMNWTCQNTTAPGQPCGNGVPCYPGNACFQLTFGNASTCNPIGSAGQGMPCTSGACASGLVCNIAAANVTCIPVNTSSVACTANANCTGGTCQCSPVTGSSYCIGLAYNNPCTEESINYYQCLATSSCSFSSDAPDSCAQKNCESDYKKAQSCGCSLSNSVLGKCTYNQYCGGFPVWAIIVIIVVAIVLVLAIVLLVFFMMRRRRQYDSI